MKIVKTPRRFECRREDRGIAMLAAVMCIAVVVTLSAVAMQQSLTSVSQTAQARKLLQTQDAASAGLQAEINVIRSLDDASTGTKISCSSPNEVTAEPTNGGTSNVADPASLASYTLELAVGSSQPSTAQLDACPGSAGEFTVPSTQNGVWYALIQSQGTTTGTAGGGTGSGRTLQALVQVTPGNTVVTTPSTSSTTSTTLAGPTTTVPTYGQMGTFNEALEGYTQLAPGGSFSLTDPTGSNAANAYTTGTLDCTSDFLFQGVVEAAYGGGSSEAEGACDVKGSLYVDGPISLTAGAALYNNVYAVGSVTLSGGFTISGSVYAAGNVSMSNGAQVNGSVYADGTFSMSGGTKVAQNVYAVDGITLSSGPVIAGEAESQTGAITYSGNSTSGPAFVSSGQTITPCPYNKSNGGGPSSSGSTAACNHTVANFPSQSSWLPSSANLLPAAQTFPTYTYSSAAWQAGGYDTVENDTCSSLNTTLNTDATTPPPAPYTGWAIRTACNVSWPASYGTVTLETNLAIIADGGFTVDTNGFSSSGGPYDLYLIVPTTSESGGSTSGNISIAGQLTPSLTPGSSSNVYSFVYSPNNVSTSGDTQLYGRVYAGNEFSSSGTYDQALYPISPWGQTGSQSGPATTSTTSTVPASTSTTSTTVASPTYSANASAQAANLGMANGSTAVATPAASVTNATGATSSTQNPSVSLLSSDTWLSPGALSEYAASDSSGDSYACAGLLSTSGATVGATSTGCTTSGNTGTQGVSLDLTSLPGMSGVLSSDVKLVADAVTSYAYESATGSATGTSTITNANVLVYKSNGHVQDTLAVTVPSGTNGNLLAAIESALKGSSDSTAQSLGTALSNSTALSMESNYQTTASGVFKVSAIHVALTNGSGTADMALTTVGPNTETMPTTTTSTTTTSTTSTTVPATTTTSSTTTTVAPTGGYITVEWIKQVA